MIEVQNLRKSYGPVEALRGVSFRIGDGEIVGLLGPNGAGKTTTMKILTGYSQPSEGRATVAGIDVVADTLAAQAQVGYLPENAPVYHDMVVQEYLLLMADLRQLPVAERRGLISEAVRATGLAEQLTRPIGTLSKGYRQRVMLAAAIMHKPRVLILDEPTNGLDPTQILEMRDLIRRLAKSSTVIVSTHHLSEVQAVCHRAIIIMKGQIRADARLDELTATSNAVAAISAPAGENVVAGLREIPGVQAATLLETADGFPRYRITGGRELSLCPLIYDLVREKGWRLAELRPETRTLEGVFRDLASQAEGVAA
jgi:ABC-2 type transport system ATP-binding protein